MGRIRDVVESAKLKAKQFKERRALKKIYVGERKEIRGRKLEERLGQQEKIEKKRASIRRLQQKHIPKRVAGPSLAKSARIIGGPSIFDVPQVGSKSEVLPEFKQPEQTSMLPSFDEPKKKKKSKGLFDF